jgi:hypothetical protein
MASVASLGATRLSWDSLCKAYQKASQQRLARIWPLVLAVTAMTVLLTGCVFPEPPDYQRKNTPPILSLPVPSTFEILSVKAGDPILFSVLVRSEDADGDGLFAWLYKNYKIRGIDALLLDFRYVEPGRIDEERQINVKWNVPSSSQSSCEQVTLVVSHHSNLVNNYSNDLIDDADVDTMTWWAEINDFEGTLAHCPRSSGGTL